MVDRDDKASDNFNLARLCLACLVIISHAPELLDGNRSRELLTQTFHTISFGEFAVDGFFIISGYLITASYQGTDSTSVFLFKRIARIYPGFCVAWLVCLLLIAPLSGATLWPWHLVASEQLFFGMFLLQGPRLPDAFHGLHYPVLDGAMWTIPYEFRCYLLVALAGKLGLLACRKWVFAAALSVLAGSTATQIGWLHPSLPPAFFLATLDPVQFLRLFGCFAMGMCLFLFRDRISYKYTSLWFASFLLFLMMRQPGLADLGVATAGAYLLIFLARAPNVFGSRRFLWGHDLSYGLYLYAWPISSLFILHYPHLAPVTLALLTLIFAGCAGFASWRCIERPALRFSRRVQKNSLAGLAEA